MNRTIIFAAALSLLGLIPSCGENTDDALFIASVVASLPTTPNVRMTNNTGGTLANLGVYSVSGCTGSSLVLSFNNLANATTSAYQSLAASTYYINTGTCVSTPFTFTSGTTLVPKNVTCTITNATTVSCL